MKKYIAAKGDTWDSISYAVYGDEMLFPRIMSISENFFLSDTLVFDGGEIVHIPDTVIKKSTFIATPWSEEKTVRKLTAPWGKA